jgi:hypothetical protein
MFKTKNKISGISEKFFAKGEYRMLPYCHFDFDQTWLVVIKKIALQKKEEDDKETDDDEGGGEEKENVSYMYALASTAEKAAFVALKQLQEAEKNEIVIKRLRRIKKLKAPEGAR